eukprot:3941837-Rhodomonas_salina.1
MVVPDDARHPTVASGTAIAYAATRLLLPAYATCLHAVRYCDSVSVYNITEYAATRLLLAVLYYARLCCYTMCSTEIAYAPTPSVLSYAMLLHNILH